MSRREEAIRQMIDESRGIERGVLIDVYRHLKFANFVGGGGKSARAELDRDYPSQGLFEPLRSATGQYKHAQDFASDFIQANVELNDQLTDQVRTALASVLARLIDEGVLDPPQDDLSRSQAPARRTTDWDFLVDGTIEDIHSYLESRLGTPDFSVDSRGMIQLRLPEVDRDRRPRASGETRLVTFSPPVQWAVERPGNALAHAVPRGADATLCGTPRDSWTAPVVQDDTVPVSCPWCRVRLIAAEDAAPSGPRKLQPRNLVARDVLQELVGKTIYTVARRQPNRILRIEGDDVIVATGKAPQGEPVPIQEVQTAFDRLYTDGELLINPKSVGYRSAFIGAVLSTVEGVQIETDPRRAILTPRRENASAG